MLLLGRVGLRYEQKKKIGSYFFTGATGVAVPFLVYFYFDHIKKYSRRRTVTAFTVDNIQPLSE